jgi:hypothetical protein
VKAELMDSDPPLNQFLLHGGLEMAKKKKTKKKTAKKKAKKKKK